MFTAFLFKSVRTSRCNRFQNNGDCRVFNDKRTNRNIKEDIIIFIRATEYVFLIFLNAPSSSELSNKEIQKTENNGAFVIKVDYICEEDIAQKEEIMINE